MKYSKLSSIVNEYIKHLIDCAAYNGSHSDGGAGHYQRKLSEFKQNLIFKMDLRPSEYHKLDEVEVGEPKAFSDAFARARQELAKKIEL